MRNFKSFLSLFLLLVSCSSGQDLTQDQSVNTTETIAESGNNESAVKNPNLIEFEICKTFEGAYEVTIDCKPGASFETIFDFSFNDFDAQVNNISIFNNYFYVILNDGFVYRYSEELDSPKLIFDLTEKIDEREEKGGLVGLAFHPEESYFLTSFIRAEEVYSLYVEKISYDETFQILDSKLILKIDDVEKQRDHFGGHLIWSDYYQGFMLGVGDFYEANAESRLNPKPQATDNLYGKILLLESSYDLSVPNVSKSNDALTKENIIAYGLRNSWQFFEYKNFLIVTDVGLSFNEELNIVKMSNKSLNFGWPVYEGLDKSSDLDQIKNYDLGLYYFDNDKGITLDKFLETELIRPQFQYKHSPTEEVYRAAIIGGDIFKDINSKYFQEIFFADYLSNELFSISLTTREFNIFPLDGLNENFTSLRVLNESLNTLIGSTQSGKIVKITLP